MKTPQSDKKRTVISFDRKDGWFVFSTYEIQESLLEKHGKKTSEIDPEIFPVFKDQLVRKVRDIFEI